MKRILLLLPFLFILVFKSNAQLCPGDINILEDDNLRVWKVESNGVQIFSLAEFSGTVTIGPDTYFQDDFGVDARGLVLMAHDLSGGLLWSRQISGTSFFTTNPALVASPDAVIISATSIENGNTQHHFKIESFAAPDGIPGWSKNYIIPVTSSNLPFGAQINPYAADFDGTGRLIIAGAFSGSVTLGATTLTTTTGLSETFVMAVNETDGTDLWSVQSTGSSGLARAWTMKVSPSSEIVISGRFTGRVDFNGVSYTAGNNTTVNPYIAKLNPADGTALWVSAFEGQTPGSVNNIYNITFTPFGGIYYVGSFNDAIDVQGNLVNSGLSGDGGTDALIGALNADGSYRWANQLGGVSTNDEFATTIDSNSDGDLYIGVQLVTDQAYYGNAALDLPPLGGHYLFGLDSLGNPANAIDAGIMSAEDRFGYDTYFNQGTNDLYYASLIANDGVNVAITDFSSRPVPIVNVQTQTAVLDPTETLTAFDPGGGLYTYQWYKNGIAITDSTLSDLFVNSADPQTGNGSYYVEVTGPGACPVQSEPIFLLDGTTLEADSLALVNLYNNTNGASWNDNTNWLAGNVSTWVGVGVNGGRITDLTLPANNLTGSINSTLSQLAQLQTLDLSSNNITGTLPNSFWSIPTLSSVQLCCGNSISGTLPSTIGSLNLVVLDLGGNNFTGTLPPELFNNTSLEFVNLWDDEDNGMNLTGTLPATIGDLTVLNTFNIAGNQLSGTVPAEVANLTSLVTFDLSGNQFTGAFPESIWAIPTLESLHLGENQNLEVNLPANLDQYTQFREIRLDNTLPIGGPFPTDLYSLTNLQGLSLGNKRYTGTLDAQVGNWTQLDNIYIWNNQLEGDFPVEITNATNLRALVISGNSFTSFPDLSPLAGLQELDIAFNQLGFRDIIPNIGIGIENLRYAPQNRRPELYLEVAEGGNITFNNPYDEANNNFQWVRNITDTLTNTTRNLTITGATLNDLGGYFGIVTNSVVPDLTIFTPFYNLAFSGDPRSWTVDNSVGSVADFKSLYAAIYGTNDNDTLYVLGSPRPYNIGGKLIQQPRLIYGPGYFLSENSETQARTDSAFVNQLLFKSGAEGSQVYGLSVNSIILNNQPSFSNDTLKDITLTSNKIYELAFNDDNQGHTLNKNFITKLIFSSTPLAGVSRSYQDFNISNNIIDTVTTLFARATVANNVMNNIVFDRNTIRLLTDSVENATLANNIIDVNQASIVASESGTIDFATANFDNTSGTLSIDNDFQTTANVGAFSGGDPYVLSGIPPLPHIFSLNDIGRIRFDTEAKFENGSDIVALNYVLGENRTVVQKGNVSRLEAGNPIQVLFRPRLGNVTPGAIVDMMIWPRDASGLKGVPQRAQFTAETTTATGNIFTPGNQPVTNGNVLLFEINQEGAAFDTLSTTLNNQGAFTFNNIVIGDYLALAEANENDFPGHLPTYYQQIDLWEEADTLLIDTGSPTFNITLIAEPRDPEGSGTVAGILEEELPDGSTGGRTLARGRVKKAGASMRRKVGTSRPEEDEYELVEYVFTNDNGEFLFENLPTGEYRINIQYPGYPMDTTSNIDIVIEETRNNAYQLAALVDEGKISVTVLSTTGVLDEIIEKVKVYPNPATREGIQIAFTREINLKGEVSIELLDPKGNIAIRKSIDSSALNADRQINLPLTNVSQGVYLLRMTHQTGEIGTLRIIVH